MLESGRIAVLLPDTREPYSFGRFRSEGGAVAAVWGSWLGAWSRVEGIVMRIPASPGHLTLGGAHGSSRRSEQRISDRLDCSGPTLLERLHVPLDPPHGSSIRNW